MHKKYCWHDDNQAQPTGEETSNRDESHHNTEAQKYQIVAAAIVNAQRQTFSNRAATIEKARVQEHKEWRKEKGTYTNSHSNRQKAEELNAPRDNPSPSKLARI